MHKFWENPIASTVAPAGAKVPDSVQIGGLRIAPATILAPMAGVTDTVFRRFIRNASFLRGAAELMAAPDSGDALFQEPNQGRGESDSAAVLNNDALPQEPRHPEAGQCSKAVFENNEAPQQEPKQPESGQSSKAVCKNNGAGCGLLMTEFTSADGLFRTRKSKRERYLHFYEDEHPISAQLFGSDPYTLAESAKIVEDAGFDLVDLNLGCPAKRVVKCNGGSGLLKDLPVIKTIFEAMRAAVKIPFTVKFRLGWDDNNIVCVRLGQMAQDCGLNAVALHARTREQGYSGNARWDWIAAVKDAVTIPVIGNGDIRTPEDAVAMVAQTGCGAVMIGRTAASNPWIFRQIRQHAETGCYDRPTEADRYEMIRTYFRMLIEESGHGSPGKMKQFVAWFTHGVPNGGALRKAVYSAREGPEILASVEAFFDALLTGPADEQAITYDTAEPDLLPACGD